MEGWELFWHVVERETIHFFAAPSIYLTAFFFLDPILRKKFDGWERKFWARLITPGIPIPWIIFLREPFDVAVGGWLGKSYIDLVWWNLGVIYGIWMAYRFVKAISVEAVQR